MASLSTLETIASECAIKYAEEFAGKSVCYSAKYFDERSLIELFENPCANKRAVKLIHYQVDTAYANRYAKALKLVNTNLALYLAKNLQVLLEIKFYPFFCSIEFSVDNFDGVKDIIALHQRIAREGFAKD